MRSRCCTRWMQAASIHNISLAPKCIGWVSICLTGRQKHSTIPGHPDSPRISSSSACRPRPLYGLFSLPAWIWWFSILAVFENHKYNELMKFPKAWKLYRMRINTFLLVNWALLALSASASFSAFFFSSSACLRFSSCAFRNVVTNVKRVEITAENGHNEVRMRHI